MSRRRSTKSKSNKRGFLDPDYRRSGWSTSRFAPKNRVVNITQLAGLITVALFIGVFFAWRAWMMPAAYQWVLGDAQRRSVDEYIWQALSPISLQVCIAFFAVWIVVGLAVRTLAWREISRRSAAEEQGRAVQPAGFDSPPSWSSLAELTPEQFECEVARLITLQTGLRAEVVGGAGDEGVDIKVFGEKGRLVGIVQCKRYQPGRTLDRSYVDELVGVRQRHKVKIAYLATSARFSPRTREIATEHSIRLIDGQDLRRIRAAEEQLSPILKSTLMV